MVLHGEDTQDQEKYEEDGGVLDRNSYDLTLNMTI